MITKVDAARRQLDLAIELYFRSADSVSIHTLASAAGNILSALCKANSRGRSLAKDWSFLSRPELRKTMHDAVHSLENFFKHGSKDPSATVSLDPKITELLLFDACYMHQSLTGESSTLMLAFTVWFRVMNPEYAVAQPETITPVRNLSQKYGKGDRARFLGDFIRHRTDPV